MPTPSRPENACVTGVRCTSRTITATTAAAAAATSAGVQLLAGREVHDHEQQAGRDGLDDAAHAADGVGGRELLGRERAHPAQAALLGRDDVVDRVEGPGRRIAWSGSLTGTRPQLVARVEHGAPAVDQAHQALDLQPAARA